MRRERILVTGSSGHLGEGLVRVLRAQGRDVVGLDVLASAFTDVVASVADREPVQAAMRGVSGVLHAATLHKPHVGTHGRQQFVDTNVTGTLTLLEEAVAAGVESFVFTSTTSAFGRALVPAAGSPAAWVTEDVVPVPRNVYGVTKTAAEDLCALIQGDAGLPIVILRTSRFFPEGDDRDDVRAAYDDANLKANEILYRRVDLQDLVDAHLLALERAPAIGFGRYIVSATTPFTRDDLPGLRSDAPASCAACFPTTRRSTPGGAGACFPRSSGSTSTPARAPTSAGRPATTSATCSIGWRRMRIRAAHSPARSAPRATTRPRRGHTRCADGARCVPRLTLGGSAAA